MATKRKLFLTHAGELAHYLVRDVTRNGLVARFVRGYAERHARLGLLSDPQRLPELESTIGRESLLVMAAEVHRLLSQEFPRAPKGERRPHQANADQASFADAFFAEFLSSLMRSLNLPPSEVATDIALFRRDLDMYERWSQRPSSSSGAARPGENHVYRPHLQPASNESPFRDRGAFLLDAAMMEQARRAAAEFEREILLAAAHRFRQLGRSGPVVTRKPKRQPPKRTAKSSNPRTRPKAGRKPSSGAAKKLPSRTAKPRSRNQSSSSSLKSSASELHSGPKRR